MGKSKGKSLHLRIPGKADWEGYDADLDVKHLHKLFFGKDNSEVERHFANGRAIERMDELLFAPRRVFQYYVHAFVGYLRSEEAKGDSDAASPFLSLLESREKRDPGSVAAIYSQLSQSIEFVASHQEYFEADPNIYGDFRERAKRIGELCGA